MGERITLEGKQLLVAPNPTVLREGMSLILAVITPDLLIQKTAREPSKGTILIFPGGGYQVLAIQHEGTAVADLLNKNGYDTALLEYSISGADARERALADALKAVKLLQTHGKDFGINTSSLGLIGFSAGGHLASRVLHELGSPSPFTSLMLIYPAYLNAPTGIIPEVTPPKGISTKVFVIIGANDQPDWIASAATYADLCKANGQTAEYHLLPDTGHGFGIQPGQTGPIATWPTLLEGFLGKK